MKKTYTLPYLLLFYSLLLVMGTPLAATSMPSVATGEGDEALISEKRLAIDSESPLCKK